MNSIPRRWTYGELKTLHMMKAAGHSLLEISNALPARSGAAVKSRLRWEAMPEDQKQNRRIGENRRRNKEYKKARGGFVNHKISATAPPDLLEARDRRLAIPPRDLTAALFGDPLPGFSALDQRRGA